MIAGLLLLAAVQAAGPPAPAGPPAAAPRPAAAAPAEDFAGSYSEDNPFARIIRGELPAAKVYEDGEVLAFMDIAPRAPGHVLVISKTSKARNLLEISPEDLARLMAVVRGVMRAQIAALGADGAIVIQNNGTMQTVGHLHFHVIPHVPGGTIAMAGTKVPLAELQPMAAKLAAAMR